MQQKRVDITGTLPASNIDVSNKLNGFVDQLEFSYTMPNTPQMAKFWIYGENICKDVFGGADLSTELKNFVDYLDDTDSSDDDSNVSDITENE